MAEVILVDSNIPMYLVGADAAAKERAGALLTRAASERRPLVTDAEVFQEIVHRDASIRGHEAIGPAFDVLLDVVVEVHPIALAVVLEAHSIALANREVRARDAVHVAVMRAFGIPAIVSFDTGLDRIEGVRRYGT